MRRPQKSWSQKRSKVLELERIKEGGNKKFAQAPLGSAWEINKKLTSTNAQKHVSFSRVSSTSSSVSSISHQGSSALPTVTFTMTLLALFQAVPQPVCQYLLDYRTNLDILNTQECILIHTEGVLSASRQWIDYTTRKQSFELSELLFEHLDSSF